MDLRKTAPGRPLVDKRQKFIELVGQGVSNEEACRIVGINPRTGREWRNGRSARIQTTVRPGKRTRPEIQPITGEKRVFLPHPLGEHRASSGPVSCRYLSEEERIRIADLRREKKSVRSIAAELGRSSSTVSREIRRNCNQNVRPNHPAYYRPFAAHKRAETRRARPKPRRIETCPELRNFVQARLDEKWSPRADREHPPPAVSGPPGDARDTRDDLSRLVFPGQERALARDQQAPPYRPLHAEATPAIRPEDPAVHSPDGPDQSAPRRSR